MNVIISIIALCISLLSLIISYKKYSFDKGKIIGKVRKVNSSLEYSFYPLMENDKSEYKINIDIINTGNKDILIQNVMYYNRKVIKNLIYNEDLTEYIKVVPKEPKNINVSIARYYLVELRTIVFITVEGQRIRIKSKIFNTAKKEIENRITKEKAIKDKTKVKTNL